eukprot:3496739-Amphidinium_carterae.1
MPGRASQPQQGSVELSRKLEFYACVKILKKLAYLSIQVPSSLTSQWHEHQHSCTFQAKFIELLTWDLAAK